MSLILCIDTALETATIAIAEDGIVRDEMRNEMQADHAAWIHIAIKTLLSQKEITLKDLDAIAVTSGPGSYTGLRVGMATAKGLCYALSKPLITENTLLLTAMAARDAGQNPAPGMPFLYCPMIDARRMEVFTTIYDDELVVTRPPSAVILEKNTFGLELDEATIVFAGNGSGKWKTLCEHPNAIFSPAHHSPQNLATAAARKWQEQDFASLAYAEPDYFKNFFSGK